MPNSNTNFQKRQGYDKLVSDIKMLQTMMSTAPAEKVAAINKLIASKQLQADAVQLELSDDLDPTPSVSPHSHAELASLAQEISEQRASLARQEEEHSLATQVDRELEEEINGVTAQIEQLENKANMQHEQSIAALSESNRLLQTQLGERDSQTKLLLAQHSDIKAKVITMQAEIDLLHSAAHESFSNVADLDNLEAKITALQQQLDSEIDAHAATKAELLHVSQRASQSSIDRDNLSHLRVEVTEYQSELEVVKEKFDVEKKAHAATKSELTAMRAAINEANQSLSSLQALQDALEQTTSEFTTTKQALDAEIRSHTSCKAELTRSRQAETDLRHALNQMAEQLESAKRNFELASSQISIQSSSSARQYQSQVMQYFQGLQVLAVEGLLCISPSASSQFSLISPDTVTGAFEQVQSAITGLIQACKSSVTQMTLANKQAESKYQDCLVEKEDLHRQLKEKLLSINSLEIEARLIESQHASTISALE